MILNFLTGLGARFLTNDEKLKIPVDSQDEIINPYLQNAPQRREWHFTSM